MADAEVAFQELLDAGADVAALFRAGYSMRRIAAGIGRTDRRVRQLVAHLRPAPKPTPSSTRLFSILREEVARHGAGYGWGCLRGALRAHHPQWHFPRRKVLDALRVLFPEQCRERYHYTAQRLERGRFEGHHDGYVWQLDYACKLQNYNIYVGCIIDGKTRAIKSLVVCDPTLGGGVRVGLE